MQTSDDMPLKQFLPELKFGSEQEVLKAYEGHPIQPGASEYKKGQQTFYVPFCSKCGEDPEHTGKKYGSKSAALGFATKHIAEVNHDAEAE